MSTFKQNLKYPNSGGQTLAGHIPSTSLASGATTITTNGWVKGGSCARWILLCEVTTFAAGTAIFSFFSASDKDGTGAASITGTPSVTMTAVGHAMIELSDAMIPSAKPYICGYCITAGGTNVVKAIMVQADPAYSP
jgi:hypothetical protein